MPTLKELRLQARLSPTSLARLAHIDRTTLLRAESGTPVRDLTAYAIIDALSEKLGRKIALADVEGLNTLQ